MTMDGSANDISILDFGLIPTRRMVRISGAHQGLLAKQFTKKIEFRPEGGGKTRRQIFSWLVEERSFVLSLALPRGHAAQVLKPL
jgi:hypothetical protein